MNKDPDMIMKSLGDQMFSAASDGLNTDLLYQLIVQTSKTASESQDYYSKKMLQFAMFGMIHCYNEKREITKLEEEQNENNALPS